MARFPEDNGRNADSSEFESGLDYGAYIDEDTTSIDTAATDDATQRTAALNRSDLDALRSQDTAPQTEPTSVTASAAAPSYVSSSTTTSTTTSGSSGFDWEQENRRRETIDAEARAAARDEALEGSKVGPGLFQFLLALLAPIVMLIGVVRLVASPAFLWIEYNRPGFPADQYGFSTEDRLTYGSYGLDYLFNFAPARYLSELTVDGQPLFAASEVSHMTDVKIVMLITMAVGVVLAVLCVLFMITLARNAKGAIRRALFWGSLWLLVVMIGLGVLAVMGWDSFFAGFHSLFFADGTWTFAASDTLIRLYPNQFWMDAGITVAALVLLISFITLIATWPTRRRRVDAREAQADMIRRRAYWAEAEQR